MAVWKWTTWFGVSGLGTLTFLREVALEKERSDRAFARLQEAAEKAAARAAIGVGPTCTALEGDVYGGNGRDRGFISRQP